MKKILLGLVLTICVFQIGNAQVQRVTTEPTLFSNNGSSSISFELKTGSTPIVIKDIGNIFNSGTILSEIAYKKSPINNPSPGWSVNSGNGWITYGTYSVVSPGQTTASAITGGTMNLVIPPNSTWGFAVSGSMGYFNVGSTWPSGTPTQFTTNGDLTIISGLGVGYGGTFTNMINHPRGFVGWVDYEIQGYNNDAALTDLPYPGIPVCNALTDSLSVELTNPGFQPLDSCLIDWSVNGVMQTQVKYNTRISSNSSAYVPLTYSTNLSFGDTIKAWCSMPNGVPDSLSNNDTILFIAAAGLSGTYQVGGTTPDYTSLDSAITDLNFKGVCGPISFILNDSFNLNTVAIEYFIGTSDVNTVTFQSANGDPASASITKTSTVAATNYALSINGGENLIFKDLTISNTGTGTYAAGVRLAMGNNIAFNNCIISSAYQGSSVNAYLVDAREEKVTDLNFTNCLFEGGSWGLYMDGTTDQHANVSVNNSEFLNTFRSAIWLKEISGVNINANSISSISSNTATGAIQLADLEGYVEIFGNHITHSPAWPMIGLRINGSAGKANQHNLIMNNAFSIGDTTSAASGVKMGVDLINVAFYDVVFNSLAISTSNSSAYAFGISNSNGNEIRNNVFANMGPGGDAIVVSGLGSVLSMDNNLIYSMADFGSFSGTATSDLTDWQNSSGFDANSVSENPNFRGVDTLKMCSQLADNIGFASGLVTDIEGNLRDPLSPDPGAYEYSAITGISVEDAFICNGDDAEFFVASAASDIIIWNFTDTSSSFTTDMEGTYNLTAIGECGADTTSFDVFINELVKLSNDTSICGGDTVFAVSNITNGSYSWNTGSTSMMESLYKTGQYYINVVDSDGCFSSDTIEIIASQVVALREDTMLCEGQTVLLDPGTPAGNYTWFRNGVSISTGTQIFADSTGEFVVLYTDQNSCNSTDTFNLVINKLPRSGFTYTQNQNNLEFVANDQTGSNYFWSFGDGKSVNGPAWKTLNIYAANGSYNVSLTISSEYCGDSTSNVSINLETINVNNHGSKEGVSVYPNPTSNTVNVVYNPEVNKISKLVIMDLTGKIVHSTDVGNFESEININMEEIVNSKGVYIIKTFDTDNQVISTTRISLIK